MSAMKRLFQVMADEKGSNIFLSMGSPINITINGNAIPVNQPVLTADAVRQLLYEVLNDKQIKDYEDGMELNTSLRARRGGRAARRGRGAAQHRPRQRADREKRHQRDQVSDGEEHGAGLVDLRAAAVQDVHGRRDHARRVHNQHLLGDQLAVAHQPGHRGGNSLPAAGRPPPSRNRMRGRKIRPCLLAAARPSVTSRSA